MRVGWFLCYFIIGKWCEALLCLGNAATRDDSCFDIFKRGLGNVSSGLQDLHLICSRASQKFIFLDEDVPLRMDCGTIAVQFFVKVGPIQLVFDSCFKYGFQGQIHGRDAEHSRWILKNMKAYQTKMMLSSTDNDESWQSFISVCLVINLILHSLLTWMSFSFTSL